MKFHCKKCGQKLSAEESQRGRIVYCPTCNSMLTVPAEEEAVEDDEKFAVQKKMFKHNTDVMYIEDEVDKSSEIFMKYIESSYLWSRVILSFFFIVDLLVTIFSGIGIATGVLGMLFDILILIWVRRNYHYMKFFCGSLHGIYVNTKKTDARIRKMNSWT